MADPASYRPAPGSVPATPGVYRFSDEHGRVVYVGKAKNLRARLSTYFTDIHNLHPRTQHMVTTASAVDWTVVSTEVEALQLEYTWIKEFDPRFNVRYRDDKSYPSLAVTLHEEFPRLQVMRGPKRAGVRYFGPYPHAWAIRETLDLLLRVFPARTCGAGVFKRAGQMGRPCLLGYIGRCSAPCVGRVDEAEHRRIVENFCDFMSGRTDRYIRTLEREMAQAAAEQRYESAARLRDDIGALRQAMEKQAVVLPDGTDADVIAFAQDDLEAAVQVFYVRDGRVRGQRGWVVDKLEELTTGELVEQFLAQEYLSQAAPAATTPTGSAPTGGLACPGAANEIPREVLVPVLPPDAAAVAALLSAARGSQVDLRVPRRGNKRTLLETVERNAAQAFTLHRTKRAGDLSARSRALSDIQDALGLAEPPLRIESFDISNLQGSNVVASMVVFEDGLPRKSEYRRFAIRGVDGQDDVASMYETISRRFSRYLAEQARTGDVAGLASPSSTPPEPVTDQPRRFAYPPSLVVVDGGPPQVAAARRALDTLGIDSGPGGIALCGLAKRLEEVWLPAEDDPVILPRTSEALYLLQRIRDEAHRFAITYHRQKRSQAMVHSLLDDVPGLGETRRKALLATFGSLARIRRATVDQIAEVPGIGRRTAQAVVDALAAAGPGTVAAAAPAVDPYTGEILGTDGTAPVPPPAVSAPESGPSGAAAAGTTTAGPGSDTTSTWGVPT
ncbi:excinuclease ABC subunit UvrC [Frankia sp. Cj5]|uniref:excinuclease ABC subunit UvrC n=1 Tax=Frankia sp. Cj5 TaxID=2880978 RepID=UPI001EF51984|nr:excinuclease ABC subunit UvrC [Frankia sp. Cj5]